MLAAGAIDDSNQRSSATAAVLVLIFIPQVEVAKFGRSVVLS
jgi:hypothetical protein